MEGLGGQLGNMVGQATGRPNGAQVNAPQSGLKPWSPDDQQRAERAQFVMNHLQRHGSIPWVASESAFPDRLQEIEQARASIMRAAKASGELELNPYITYSMQTSPVAVQGLLQDKGQLPQEGKRPQLQNGMIEVPPGSKVRARFKGACLDDELPAPSKGEALTLRRSDDYIHPQLQAVYQGVNKLRSQGAMSYNDYQQLVWAIRNVSTKDTPYIKNLSSRHIRLLDQASPGGANTLKRTHALESNNPLGDMSKAIIGELNNRFQLNLNGQTLTPQQLFQQGGTDQAINTLLDGVLGREAAGNVQTNDNSNFTVIGDAVAISAHAADRLDPEITLVNAGTEPYWFNPSDYVLESRRETQRVSIPQAEGSEFDVDYEILPITTNEGVSELTQRIMDDFYLFSVDTVLRSAPGWVQRSADSVSRGVSAINTRVGALWAPIMNKATLAGDAFRYARDQLGDPAVRRQVAGQLKIGSRFALDAMPVVGNAFSLYEAIAGHHILERDNPSSMPERGLALIGVIPGAKTAITVGRGIATNAFAQRAAAELTRKASVMLDQYANSQFVSGLQKSEALRDIAWWTLSDAHEMLAEEVDARVDSAYTQPWNETMAYVKSL
jgi:hypothetical protein